jgi:hypothetical protein
MFSVVGRYFMTRCSDRRPVSLILFPQPWLSCCMHCTHIIGEQPPSEEGDGDLTMTGSVQ